MPRYVRHWLLTVLRGVEHPKVCTLLAAYGSSQHGRHPKVCTWNEAINARLAFLYGFLRATNTGAMEIYIRQTFSGSLTTHQHLDVRLFFEMSRKSQAAAKLAAQAARAAARAAEQTQVRPFPPRLLKLTTDYLQQG